MSTESSTIQFSPESLEISNRIIARYPEGRQKSALLQILHLAQAEFGGWLSPQTMDYRDWETDRKSVV